MRNAVITKPNSWEKKNVRGGISCPSCRIEKYYITKYLAHKSANHSLRCVASSCITTCIKLRRRRAETTSLKLIVSLVCTAGWDFSLLYTVWNTDTRRYRCLVICYVGDSDNEWLITLSCWYAFVHGLKCKVNFNKVLRQNLLSQISVTNSCLWTLVFSRYAPLLVSANESCEGYLLMSITILMMMMTMMMMMTDVTLMRQNQHDNTLALISTFSAGLASS